MTFTHWVVGFVALLLFGCNKPTPSSQVAVPYFPSEQYEHLDCPRLKEKIDKSNRIVEEFSVAQENRSKASQGHTLYYGWGSGDGMDTIELAKAQGERSAVQRVYEKKRCTDMDGQKNR